MLLLAGSACGPASSASPEAQTLETPGAGSAPTTQPTVASASPRPSAASGWQHSPDQDVLANAHLRGVIWTGSRFLLIDDLGESLLDSEDGRSWHRQPALPGSRSTGPPGLLAAGPGGVIAIGGGGDASTGIWRSVDGLVWASFAVGNAFRARSRAFGGPATSSRSTTGGWPLAASHT
jgi:hypothetical protein